MAMLNNQMVSLRTSSPAFDPQSALPFCIFYSLKDIIGLRQERQLLILMTCVCFGPIFQPGDNKMIVGPRFLKRF